MTKNISYGRFTTMVKSETRPGSVHVIDFEGFENDVIVCTCEDFILGGNKRCKHIINATLPLAI